MATRTRSRRASAPRTRVRRASRSATISIRCKINRLPVKSMLYALLYITDRASRHSTGNPDAMESISVLKAVSTKLRENGNMEAGELHRILDTTVSSYVDFYYSLNSSITKAVLRERHSRLLNGENILTMPALMMANKVPKSIVASAIQHSLYKKPFVFLHSAISTSRRMESMRASMALKKSADFTMERLTYSLQELEKVMDSIDDGRVKPGEDESVKTAVIRDIVGLSEQYDAHTLSYINSKLDEISFNMSTAQRIVRE